MQCNYLTKKEDNIINGLRNHPLKSKKREKHFAGRIIVIYFYKSLSNESYPVPVKTVVLRVMTVKGVVSINLPINH